MQLYESRLNYFNDKARINYCKPPSVYQHGGPSRPRQNCHSCIFETKENSNLRICIQYLGHHSKTTCQKSAKSMRYCVRPKFEFYRKSLLTHLLLPNGRGRRFFLPTNKTFEGICLGVVGKFLSFNIHDDQSTRFLCTTNYSIEL